MSSLVRISIVVITSIIYRISSLVIISSLVSTFSLFMISFFFKISSLLNKVVCWLVGWCGRGPGTSLACALLSVISKTAILSSCSLCPASHFVLAPILSCCSLCPVAQFVLVITLPGCLREAIPEKNLLLC